MYVAASGMHQDGWRDLQSSDLENFYGDIGWRGDTGELHFNTLLANSRLNGPGTSPVELLAADPAAQFTGPNAIYNTFVQVSLSGNVAISDTISLQAVTYYNNFLQRVTNGNAPNDVPCNDGSGLLCSDPGPPRPQHHARRRHDPGVPRRESVFLFGAGQPDHEHQWLRRLDPGDRHADRVRLQEPPGRRHQLRRRTDRVHWRFLYRRHHPGHPRVHRPGRGHRRARQQRAGAGGRSAMRITARSSPTRST